MSSRCPVQHAYYTEDQHKRHKGLLLYIYMQLSSKIFVGLFCWTILTIVVYDVLISQVVPPRFRFSRAFKINKLLQRSKQHVLERQHVLRQPATSHQHVILVLPLTPEPQFASLLSQLQSSDFPSAVAVNLTAAISSQRGNLDWKESPLWISRTDDAHTPPSEDFSRAVQHAVSGRGKVIIVHSPSLPLFLPEFLDALPGGSKISCVVARRPSMSDQVYLAMTKLEYHRMSALEMRRALMARIDMIESLCKSVKTFELVPNSTTWAATQSASFELETGGGSKELDALFLTAVSNSRDANSRYDSEAYVSILTAPAPEEGKANRAKVDNNGGLPEYLEGVVGLGRSIAFFDSSRERILLVTQPEDVPDPTLRLAAHLGGWTLKFIDPIEDRWFANEDNGCRHRPTRSHQAVRWGRMASKMRVFDMTTHKAVLYLDLDIVVTGKVSELFHEVPAEFQIVSEGGVQHAYLNAGFLFLRPSKATFQGLMKYYETRPPPRIFNNLIDCTEMGLLNAYFGLPEKFSEAEGELRWVPGQVEREEEQEQKHGRTGTLPLKTATWTVGRPDLSRNFVSNPPLAVHFIRKDICPKPWDPGARNLAEGKKFHSGGCARFPYVAWRGLRGE